MLYRNTENKQQELGVIPQDVHLVLDYHSKLFLLLELPTQVEIADSSVSPPTLSLEELSDSDVLGMKDAFLRDYQREVEKYERFKDSSTFLNKLSNLVELSGDAGLAEKYLCEANVVSEDSLFLKQELGNMFIHQGKYDAAEKLFKSDDLKENIYSVLRLAYIQLRSGDISKVWEYINSAFEIDEFDCSTSLFAGTLSLYERKYENAIRYFRIASEEFELSSSLHVNMGYAHWMLREPLKCEKSLSRALSINPLNKSAVIFYADVAQEVDKVENSIGYLEFYLKYEQKADVVWERLAMVSYYLGMKTGEIKHHMKSIDALKFQEALAPSPAIWSNFGLNYREINQDEKARRFYAQAIVKAGDEGKPLASVIPMHNLSLAMIEAREFPKLLGLLREYLEEYGEEVRAHRLVDRLKLFSVIALEGNNRRSEATRTIETLLNQDIHDVEVKYELMNRLLVNYIEDSPNSAKVPELINQLSEVFDNGILSNRLLRGRIANNISFSYCALDKPNDASRWISKISHTIHLDPYSTATLGLIKIKNGEIEEGKKLYLEASALTINPKEAPRFKQRMYFELAKVLVGLGRIQEAKANLKLAAKTRNEKDSITKTIAEFSDQVELLKLH